MNIKQKIERNDPVFNYPSNLLEFVSSKDFLTNRLEIQKERVYKDFWFEEYTNTAGHKGKIDYNDINNYLIPIFEKYNFKELYIESLDETLKSFHIPEVEKITIGPLVKEIPGYLFHDLKRIKEIEISNGTEIIDDEAFYGCTSLSKLFVPASIKKIGTNICGNCIFLKTIEVDAENDFYKSFDSNIIVETANNKLILGCLNSKLVDGIKVIGYRSFYLQKLLKNIELPSSIEIIEDEAFFGCLNLSKFDINSSVKIGNKALPF